MVFGEYFEIKSHMNPDFVVTRKTVKARQTTCNSSWKVAAFSSVRCLVGTVQKMYGESILSSSNTELQKCRLNYTCYANEKGIVPQT